MDGLARQTEVGSCDGLSHLDEGLDLFGGRCGSAAHDAPKGVSRRRVQSLLVSSQGVVGMKEIPRPRVGELREASPEHGVACHPVWDGSVLQRLRWAGSQREGSRDMRLW